MLKMKKPVAPTTFGRNKLTIQPLSQILVVSICMLSLFRPSFEEIEEGRILRSLPLDHLLPRFSLATLRDHPRNNQN
jgi:hypothetical protein